MSDAHRWAGWPPGKTFGIGLNYVDHAGDLDEKAPEDEPASFPKWQHTLIGPGDDIVLPPESQKVTAEAEVALVIGERCYRVDEDDALDYVAGMVVVLDQTAEDILRRNPRFLTRSKNFPTFLSVGTELKPVDEVVEAAGSIEGIAVTTVRNGEPQRTNVVGNMTFGPAYLVSFHSQVMPLEPGDIICTGPPGAVPVSDGDTVEAHVTGFSPLSNSVVRNNS